MNLEQFYCGNEWYAYEFFGAHICEDGVLFRVYAPRAKKVTIIGSFNHWHDEEMQCQGRGGIYTLCVPNAKIGDLYKYRIYHQDGTRTDKADPYGFSMELRPCSASIITDLSAYCFDDAIWMNARGKGYNQPVNIYEIHPGSWKCREDGFYSYKELAEKLIPYLKDMGYTHVELMPLSEHPFDGSWGYQSTGFYAPTSRYGTPQELMCFVDLCHKSGIGVILDFVMVHFAVDDYGLSMFDGEALYEMPYTDIAYSEWGSCNFAVGRGEVASFLKSCANYWLTVYHIDGLRMDAISNMIYWRGQAQCGVNEQAISFIKSLNDGLHNIHASAMLIAEDSTSFLKVTAPVQYDGLGFDYKWDLGFMHDTLNFFKMPVQERRQHYQDLLFSMHYFYNELYLLAFSHDEVVHGKKTILDKMYGNYEEKFAQCRAMLLYVLCHPGKKLQFMGNEIGQFREWAEYREQDFAELLKYPMHQGFQRLCRDMNRVYCTTTALYEGEYNSNCFRYIINDRNHDLVYGFIREAGGKKILAVFNFSDQKYLNYSFRIEGNYQLTELIDTEKQIYGGKHDNAVKTIYIRNGLCQLDLERFSGRLFVFH